MNTSVSVASSSSRHEHPATGKPVAGRDRQAVLRAQADWVEKTMHLRELSAPETVETRSEM